MGKGEGRVEGWGREREGRVEGRGEGGRVKDRRERGEWNGEG